MGQSLWLNNELAILGTRFLIWKLDFAKRVHHEPRKTSTFHAKPRKDTFWCMHEWNSRCYREDTDGNFFFLYIRKYGSSVFQALEVHLYVSSTWYINNSVLYNCLLAKYLCFIISITLLQNVRRPSSTDFIQISSDRWNDTLPDQHHFEGSTLFQGIISITTVLSRNHW